MHMANQKLHFASRPGGDLSMRLDVSNILIVIACIVLIILVMLVYLRSRQGDERIMRAINQTFLPLLGAILITLGLIFSNQGNVTCEGIPNILRYAAVIVAVFII